VRHDRTALGEVKDMVSNPKILIVEDNELNMKLCCAVLKDRYQIYTAETAEEALECARRDSAGLDSDGYPASGDGWIDRYADHQAR